MTYPPIIIKRDTFVLMQAAWRAQPGYASDTLYVTVDEFPGVHFKVDWTTGIAHAVTQSTEPFDLSRLHEGSPALKAVMHSRYNRN